MPAEPSSDPIDLHAAGAPRLVRGGAELRTGTRKALALAVLLALDGPLRRERLASLLWPQAEPGVARRNLRRDVFRLRECGLDVAEAAGDALALAGVALAWPAPDGAELLWLDGLESAGGAELAEWLAPQRARLHERWLGALVEQAGRLEAGGDERGAAALWQSLLAEAVAGADFAPARHALVRLHQRLGEHERALAVATAARGGAAAAEGFARDRPPPAPPAPRSAAPSAAPHAALPARLPFVGRQAQLDTVLRAARAGRVVFIDGAPGVGKTRLAFEAAAGLGGALWVPCHPGDAEQPFSSALRMLARLREAAPGVVLPPWVRTELAPLVPEWAAPGQPPRTMHALLHMRRAFEIAWRTLAHDNFGAVVLDDWQWADASSLALWDLDRAPDDDAANAVTAAGPAAPAEAPVARLVVHRQAALPAAALERRRQLLDRGLAVAVAVEPLAADDLLALLRHLAGTEGGERFSARLHGATGGNPLFVLETLRHLFAAGLLEADAAGRWHTPFDAVTERYEELPVPATVHDAVLERVRGLGAPLRRVLEAASLAGASFRARDLAAAAGLDERAAADALEHAAAANLVEPDERGAAGRHAFTHDLIRQALDDSLTPARRVALHSQLADAFERGDAEPAVIAGHLAQAGRAKEAARWHLRAAAAAERVGAWAEAERQFGLAAAHAADDALRCEAERGRGRARWRQDDTAAAEAAFERALGHARHAGAEAVAETLLARAELWAETNRAEAALRGVDALLAEPQLTPSQRHRALEQRADCLAHLGRMAESLPVLRELLATLPATALIDRRRIGDTLARHCIWAGEEDAGRALVLEALAEARVRDDAFQMAQHLQRLGSFARDVGDRAASFAYSHEAVEQGRRGGNLHSMRAALYNLVILHTDGGNVAAALPLIEQAEAAAPVWPTPHLRQMFAEARYYVHFLLGDAAAARAAAAVVLAMARAADNVHVRLGGLMLVLDLPFALDDLPGARALLDEMRAVLDTTQGAVARADEVGVREWQWALAAGARAQAQAALAGVAPAFDRLRSEERVRLAACAARTLAPDDEARAWGWIERGRAVGDASLELQGLLGVAALEVAGPQHAADARRHAEALLADTHLPAFTAAALRRALPAG